MFLDYNWWLCEFISRLGDQAADSTREREPGDEGLTSAGREAGLCGLTAKNSLPSSDMTYLPFMILTLTKK